MGTVSIREYLSLSLALILSGCGGTQAPAASDDPVAQQPQPEQPPVAAEPNPDQIEPPPADGLDQARLKVKDVFSGSTDEPTSKDAAWSSPTTFKVAVLDDGTPRNGYAQYVCMVLDDYGFKGRAVTVQIVDGGQLPLTDEARKLGEAKCS